MNRNADKTAAEAFAGAKKDDEMQSGTGLLRSYRLFSRAAGLNGRKIDAAVPFETEIMQHYF